MELSTKQKGDIGEQMVVLRALRMGWAALLPVGDRLRYDVAIDAGCGISRVQVKTVTSRTNESLYVPTRTVYLSVSGAVSTCYQECDFDFLAACDIERDRVYVMPASYSSQFSSGFTVKPDSEFLEAWHLVAASATLDDGQ